MHFDARRYAALILIFLFGLAPAAPAQERAGANPIMVGQTIALSGNLAEHGKAVQHGALAYLERINRHGGIAGRQVVLKTLDDEGDAQRAAENTKKLIEEDKVVAVFGGIEGGPCVASMKVASEKKIPLVACMAGSPELREPFQRYAFPVRAAHLDEFAKLIETVSTFGYRRVAFLHSDSDTGRQHLANVRRLLAERKLELVLAIPLPGKPDPARIAAQLKEAGIEAMFNHGAYATYAEIIREAKKLGVATQFMAINSGAQQMVRSLGKDATGLIFTQVVPYPWSGVPAVVKEFREAFKEHSPDAEVSFSALEGFVSAKVLVEALGRAAKRQPMSQEGLIVALESMKTYDLGGMAVSFTRDAHKGTDFVDIVVVANDGRFVR